MKTLVGLDLVTENYGSLKVLEAIGFEKQTTHLSFCIEPSMPLSNFEVMPAGFVASSYIQSMEEAGCEMLHRAKEEAEKFSHVEGTGISLGSPASVLSLSAVHDNYDLVAVTAHQKSTLETLLSGSVSKSLAIGCPKSILVARGDWPPSPQFQAVIAVDHSEYSTAAIKRFLEWSPKKIKKVTLVTAYEIANEEQAFLESHLSALGMELEKWVEAKLHEKSQALAAAFEGAGVQTRIIIHRGETNHVLSSAMKETGADLLVMGAQGHGFMERFLVGSIALHQVMNQPYPVLIVRKP